MEQAPDVFGDHEGGSGTSSGGRPRRPPVLHAAADGSGRRRLPTGADAHHAVARTLHKLICDALRGGRSRRASAEPTAAATAAATTTTRERSAEREGPTERTGAGGGTDEREGKGASTGSGEGKGEGKASRDGRLVASSTQATERASCRCQLRRDLSYQALMTSLRRTSRGSSLRSGKLLLHLAHQGLRRQHHRSPRRKPDPRRNRML